jgi:hypothetical protein
MGEHDRGFDVHQAQGTLTVPPGAVKLRCSLVSGGSGTITGVMVIDDLSVARLPVANLLAGNFWINPSFELGADLGQSTGSVSNWSRVVEILPFAR